MTTDARANRGRVTRYVADAVPPVPSLCCCFDWSEVDCPGGGADFHARARSGFGSPCLAEVPVVSGPAWNFANAAEQRGRGGDVFELPARLGRPN